MGRPREQVADGLESVGQQDQAPRPNQGEHVPFTLVAAYTHLWYPQALAWCPWKPELLATGTMYPDGKIRIWNVNDSNFGTSPPAHVLSLNTSVTSLLWSPHCKELLSTHGVSWLPRGGASDSCPNLPSSASAPGSSPSPAGTGAGAGARRDRPVSAKTALTNALAVHSFPSLRRVVSVPAHQGPIGHA